MQDEFKKVEDNGRTGVYILTALAVIGFFVLDGFFLKFYCLYILVLSYVSAVLGKDREIGYNNAFYATFFLGGLIGFIITLASKRLNPAQPIVVAVPNAPAQSVADELLKLNQLKEQGIITEEEFQQQKAKLMS